MKIAQIAPLFERVPPQFYGGTERIVAYLIDALVAQGHDVTLFASRGSITAARLVPCAEQALRLNAAIRDPIPYYMLMLDRVRSTASQFDILHFHIDQFHFPIFRDRAAQHAHDTAWPPGLAGPQASLRGISRDAAGFGIGSPAPADP